MTEAKVVRLQDVAIVTFGPGTRILLEMLHIRDRTAETWVDGQEDRRVTLRRGGTIALPPNAIALRDHLGHPSAAPGSFIGHAG